jgi:hypothetical protein
MLVGAGRATSAFRVVTLIPQDKEGFGSVISHEENMKFIFEESRTLYSNQPVIGVKLQKCPRSNNLLEKLFFKRLLLLSDF